MEYQAEGSQRERRFNATEPREGPRELWTAKEESYHVKGEDWKQEA